MARSIEDAGGLARQLEEARTKLRVNRLVSFKPYPKQLDFFEMGAACDERMLRAGNQLGKSDAGGYETALHLTGLYPSWWKGHRWARPIRAWAAGESTVAVRDIQQNKLCGRPGVDADFGTGFIPRDRFADKPTLSHGATDAYDTIQVRHVSGGVSTLTFKSYEQGRTKFQGEPIDWIWDDEEPADDIYGECRARLVATQGLSVVTYTPIKGRTALVSRFDRETAPGRGLVKITVWDGLGYLPHLMTKEMVERVIASFPAHERDARALGEPVQGSGRVFLVSEDLIRFDPATLPPPLIAQLFKLWGLDFGINHPFAAVLIGWDKDADVIYVLDGFKVAGVGKLQHIPRIRNICASAPVAWPHDGHQRDKGSGEGLADQYKNPMPGMPGLNMLPDHAQFEEGGYSTETGVSEMLARFETGRLKVAGHLTEWFEEYRDYHREKGLLVKVNDDLLSATRIAIMDRRNAKPGIPMGTRDRQRSNWALVPRQDAGAWDVFTGRPFDDDRPRQRMWIGSTPPNPFDDGGQSWR